ncbi:GPI ethanolamine phosphate transferase 1-like [Tubulanus polymorphus]|uniref:GPI ethanolamine phosphate transferase 1-like n=1 Tax=Tubulanus polymorphus TaxID=672921 RepID=UPI003DA37B0D
MSTILLVIVGLLVHLVFFYSIFDIYFTSPLVHGMTPQVNTLPSPAKRLVLFVADGLRADKFYELDESGNTRTPFLRNIVEHDGAWGVSHTRVPTESRPGHVALIAGFYEDVSAVAKGWKENPVEFDSVFNESRYTWSWGSPDILPMFSKGATGDHVFAYTYPAGNEDFAAADSSKLDTWVFDKVKDFFQSARLNSTLTKMLQQDKLIFFLHLLGIDVNGHAHRPYSKEYLKNIETVDNGVEEIVANLEDFFGHDGKTAYVVTADHGMSDWGSHGAGSLSETLTPLVAWGAGVRKARRSEQNFADDFAKDWRLEGIERVDVNQADIAPLMASLIGISYPVNNVGTLPVEYLRTDNRFKAHSLWANARQMIQQFEVKKLEKRNSTLSMLFKPFHKLSNSKKIKLMASLEDLVKAERYSDAIPLAKEVIELALEGLTYYHNYDRFFLGTSVALGYVGWMGFIITTIINEHTGIQKFNNKVRNGSQLLKLCVHLMSIFTACFIIALLYVQSLPVPYYIYCLLPVILCDLVLCRIQGFKAFIQYAARYRQNLRVWVLIIIGLFGLELLLLSFFYREILSLILFGMGIWPLLTPVTKLDKLARAGWVMSCLCVGCFPLMPVVGRDHNYNYVCAACIIAVAASLYCLQRPECGIAATKKKIQDSPVMYLTIVQIVIMIASMMIVLYTSQQIKNKESVLFISQLISWSILGLSTVLPLLSNLQIVTRLFNIALALVPPYLLLSTAHEALFIVCLCFLMYFWMRIENAMYGSKSLQVYQYSFVENDSIIQSSHRPLVATDLRRAYFFLFFIMMAFFGTGNIASINSFDPSSVYCFVTVFSPFTMGGLMLVKIIIPFLLVTCTFQAIHVTMKVPLKSLFLVVLLMSDFMALHFFFLVKDHGSWLEIGTTISHYVIVMSTIIFLMLLVGLARILTTFSLRKIPLPKKRH